LHTYNTGFKVKKRGKKVGSKCVVLCPFAGNTLLLSVKVCSVNGLIMGGVLSTKDNTPSRTSGYDAKVLGNVA
jgi:hypothetical protein